MKLHHLIMGLLLLTGLMSNGQAEVARDFEAWCAQGTRTLERARTHAANQISYGQFDAAANIYLNALRSGIHRPNWSVLPISWRLMVHAERLGTKMLATLGNNPRGLKATVNALEGMYDLILQSAQEIDRAYYNTRCGYCRGHRVPAFEQRIVKMATDMLALVNRHMAYTRGTQVFPFGPSAGYLVGAEVLTWAAYSEIADLLRAESYACELMDLQNLGHELNAFNRRNSTEHERVGMFYDTHSRIEDILQELNTHGIYCR